MKQWLKEFKLALIEEKIELFEPMLDKLDFKTMTYDDDLLHQLKALLEEAFKLVRKKKDVRATEIHKMRKIMKYFQN